jgi:hypothetical protein
MLEEWGGKVEWWGAEETGIGIDLPVGRELARRRMAAMTKVGPFEAGLRTGSFSFFPTPKGLLVGEEAWARWRTRCAPKEFCILAGGLRLCPSGMALE